MFNFLFNISKLFIYSFYIKNKLKYIKNISNRDLTIINKYINNCGCITVKCVQWLVPLLENEDINKHIINILNNVYENNYVHDIKYTEYLYKKHFNKDLLEEYEIINIIGSGSIGQVYKIKCVKSNKYHVMKVKHPDIESQIILFRKIFNFLYNIKIFNNLFYKYFPFKLDEFLNDFYKQTDFINECNNLLEFSNIYENNDYIIIPELIKSSNDIIIMNYIEGKCMDDLDINEHKKSKIIFLLYLFIRNNLIILNLNHGDLHKFNWKVSADDYNKIVIYDFGYCFQLDREEYDNIIMLCKLISSYEEDKKQEYIDFIKFLFNTEEDLDVEYSNRITEPEILLKQVLSISKNYNIMIKKYKVLNTLLLMILIDNYLKRYNINNNYSVLKIKKNLLDAYTFCTTYKIFPELSEHILEEYNTNYKQTEIFQSVQFNDKIKSLI
tara:strand:- start:3427 stop:4746 length:1320 start_codon:yes stop_codon:yes gene_type:complete